MEVLLLPVLARRTRPHDRDYDRGERREGAGEDYDGQEEAPAVAKKDYGRVPDYLRTIKAQIAAEKAQMEAYEREQQDSTRGSARQRTEDERTSCCTSSR